MQMLATESRITQEIQQDLATERENETMDPFASITLGKIVVVPGWSRSTHGASKPEVAVSVRMSPQGVSMSLSGRTDDDPRRRTTSDDIFTSIDNKQAVEIGQLLLKAAELQEAFAADIKKLTDEHEKIVARYKDLASGVGLADDVAIDIDDEHSTFVTRKALV